MVKLNSTITLVINDIPTAIQVLYEKESNGTNHPADNLKFLGELCVFGIILIKIYRGVGTRQVIPVRTNGLDKSKKW